MWTLVAPGDGGPPVPRAALPVLVICAGIITAHFSAGIYGIAMAATTMLGLAGMVTSLLTGRHPLYAGGRMVLIGLVATGVTFGIGSLINVDL